MPALQHTGLSVGVRRHTIVLLLRAGDGAQALAVGRRRGRRLQSGGGAAVPQLHLQRLIGDQRRVGVARVLQHNVAVVDAAVAAVLRRPLQQQLTAFEKHLTTQTNQR